MKFYFRAGFTITEIFIVISIFLIIAVMAAPLLNRAINTSSVESAAANISDLLNTAKSKSLAGFRDSRHGVFFILSDTSNDKVVYYQGDNYSVRDHEYDTEYLLPDGIDLNTDLNGNEINFFSGWGRPSATGTITVAGGEPAETVNIVVNQYVIYEE